ncbi:acyl-CoA dehydrogenase family protein [Rhodococcus sp. CX]|uniref:acyl-CoA dehydrogenase family protein n=1 Tax=Rhodococcus sp. CX TaxID=2789880 RepID=UPI0018CCED07|nr:acyl-CoA dehydrogenase family protein [Rhodococcus sp. CX]MBH0122633.1 acyl-CoA dehydrogenase family protein [Rhodococcus sp. CX]
MTTTAITINLAVDRDLQDLMVDLVAGHSGPGMEPDPAAVWATLGAVGLARLTAPEETGGSGAGWVEAAALLRTTAAGGVAVPFAETDLLAGPLRRAAGIDDSSQDTATVAVLRADGLARRVPWAGATGSVVCVRWADAGYEVADVPTDRLTVEAVEGISEVPLGSVRVDGNVTWSPVATHVVEDYVLRGALIRAIQSVGAMEGMLASAIAHTTDRTQFGRPLARFQSVQNLVVDTAAESVLARAAGDFSSFRVAVARSVVSQALAVVVRNTHQVHGAMGTTHEHTLHRLTLPALQWRSEFGSAAFWERHLSRAAVASSMDGPWPMIVEGTRIEGAASAYLHAVSGLSRHD